MRSHLWHAESQIERSSLPTIGRTINDQTGSEAAAESHQAIAVPLPGGLVDWLASKSGAAMPNAQDVLWFKSQFQPQIEAQIAGTPFSVDMVTAFACQETGEIWPVLRRKGLPTARILELCVGDTIDASPTGGGRRAFPKNKAELLAVPGGDRMFRGWRARAWSTWPSTSRATAAPRRGPTSSATASASSSSTCSSSRPSPTTSSNGTTPTSTWRRRAAWAS